MGVGSEAEGTPEWFWSKGEGGGGGVVVLGGSPKDEGYTIREKCIDKREEERGNEGRRVRDGWLNETYR